MVLYLEVTRDEFELPLAVADSIKELAKLRGVSRHTISHCVNDLENGKINKSKYLRVNVEE